MPLIRYPQCWLRYKGTTVNSFHGLEEYTAPRAGVLADHKHRGTRLSLPCSFLTKQCFFLSHVLAWIRGWSAQVLRAVKDLAVLACCRAPPTLLMAQDLMSAPTATSLSQQHCRRSSLQLPTALPMCLRVPNVAHHCCKAPLDHTENEIKADAYSSLPWWNREHGKAPSLLCVLFSGPEVQSPHKTSPTSPLHACAAPAPSTGGMEICEPGHGAVPAFTTNFQVWNFRMETNSGTKLNLDPALPSVLLKGHIISLKCWRYTWERNVALALPLPLQHHAVQNAVGITSRQHQQELGLCLSKDTPLPRS